MGEMSERVKDLQVRIAELEAENKKLAEERDEAIQRGADWTNMAIADKEAAEAERDEAWRLLDEAAFHLAVAMPILQNALESEIELPCPNCSILMVCNAGAGWICGNADPKCHDDQVAPYIGWGPYMGEGFIEKLETAKAKREVKQ